MRRNHIGQFARKDLSTRTFLIAILMLTLFAGGFGYWLGVRNNVALAGEITPSNFEETLEKLTQDKLKSRLQYLSAQEAVLYDLEITMKNTQKAISDERTAIYESRLQTKLDE